MEQHSRSEVPSTKGELLASNSPKGVPLVAQPKAQPTLHKELSHLLSIPGEQLETNSQASLLSVTWTWDAELTYLPAGGAIGGTANQIGGPLAADGIIGKQFTTGGAIGGTVQKNMGE